MWQVPKQQSLVLVQVPLAPTQQTPATHVPPAGQACPQLPQLALSVWKSGQPPLQAVCPLGQMQDPCPLQVAGETQSD